jgi:hypothetical protein
MELFFTLESLPKQRMVSLLVEVQHSHFQKYHNLIKELQDADSAWNKQTSRHIREGLEWKYAATPSG